MDSPYSKRESDLMFGFIHEKLDLILVQTTKHNGRLSKVERRNSYIAGCTAVLGMLLIPLAGYLFNQLQNLQSSVDLIKGANSAGISRSLLQ